MVPKVPGPFSPAGFVWTLGRAVAGIDGGGGSGGAAPGLPAATGSEATAPAEPGSTPPGTSDTAVPPFVAAATPPGSNTVDAALSQLAGPLSTGGSVPDAASPAPVTESLAAQSPAPGTAVLASPANAGVALAPPEFDTTSTFGVLVLAVVGAWIVSRGWRLVTGRANHDS